MNNLSGIVAIITSVLGATWYLSAKLATMQMELASLKSGIEEAAKQSDHDTVVHAVKSLHQRVRLIEAKLNQ